jgi:hypothetical protein
MNCARVDGAKTNRWCVPWLAALLAGFPASSAPAAVQLVVTQTQLQEPPPPENTFQFKASGNEIIVSNLGAIYTCCYIADARLRIEEGRIEIHERNAGRLCRAVCPFDIVYKVSRLFPGKYDVFLFREDGTLLGSDTVAVGPIVSQLEDNHDPPDPEAVAILSKGDAIVVEHQNAVEQCCIQFNAEVILQGATIAVRAKDLSPAPCNCVGVFDLTVAVPGLRPGTYRVQYHDVRGGLHEASDVTISGPFVVVTQAERPRDADPPEAEEQVLVKAEGRDVVFEWTATRQQCCLDLQASAELAPGDVVIFLFMRPEDRGPPCDCLGFFNLRFEALDLDPAMYNVTLYDFGGQDPPLIRDLVSIEQGTWFLRGAVTREDWDIDISDPVVILGHLFLGSPAALGCADAADANDDGRVDITDPIYLLTYLFLGGPAPADPFPDAGPDPTPDDIGCDEVPCNEEKLVYEQAPGGPWDFVEFCIPLGQQFQDEVSTLYPAVQFMPGSPGQIGCTGEQLLCIINWPDVNRSRICRLVSLGYIREIRGSHWD